jgi:hypothetical protein
MSRDHVGESGFIRDWADSCQRPEIDNSVGAKNRFRLMRERFRRVKKRGRSH